MDRIETARRGYISAGRILEFLRREIVKTPREIHARLETASVRPRTVENKEEKPPEKKMATAEGRAVSPPMLKLS